MNTQSIDEATIWQTLRQIMDPEIGCNIVDLGLIYNLEINGGRVSVEMTLTTPGCPMHESMQCGARNALLNLEGVEEAEVALVWEPPWNPSMMTGAGREAIGVGSF